MAVPGSVELPADVASDRSSGDVEEGRLLDAWYDTSDRRLARWGCSLRHCVGVGWIVEVPKPSKTAIRDLESVVVDGAAGDPPIRALNLVWSLTRGVDVEEVASVGGPVGPPDVEVKPLPSAPSAQEAIESALASSVARLMLLLPAARIGTDPEGVHQARVAVRRLRSDLNTFRPLLDDQWSFGLREELRWLSDELGAVRDSDVLGERLRDILSRHPEIDHDAGRGVLHQLRLKRRRDRRRLLRHLGDARATELLDHLVEATSSPATVKQANRPAREVMPKLVRKRWRRLDRAIERLGSDPTPAQLHEVRILAKRVRYATEAVAPAAGKQARKFARDAAKIQEALGELNDAAVAGAWLDSTVDRLDGPAAFAAGQMAQQLVAEARTHDRQWRSAHRALTLRTAWFS
jgi:CHAD domain-containing protein